MNSAFLVGACALGAGLLSVACVAVWLNEKGINPLGELIGRYRRLPRIAQFLLPVLIAQLIVYGSTKAPTNDVTGAGSSPTNAPATGGFAGLASPLLGVGCDSGFTTNELAAGYALWRIGTNEVWDFDLMPGAQVVESWRLRGAADDWTVCATTNLGPVAMTTAGRIVTTNGVYAAFDGRLAVVPAVHWPLLGTKVPSRVWWAETPWQSTVFTWQNAFLGRETNQPVSVQAEFTRTGDFIYRYDLSSVGTNLTSLLYYRLTPEDLEDADRDEDGLTTWEEVCLYHTDPGLVDSDGDGLSDNEEIWYGTDPTVRSVPNEDIVARIRGSATNDLYRWALSPDPDCPLTTLKLWDGFAADWPQGMTNLVYERTLNLGTANGWQHYFLSSKEMEAGDWELRGLVLEWEDGQGQVGTVTASPIGDSYPLPLTNSTVTIRLRAIGPKVRCPKPMYLIGYAPKVTLSGGSRFDNPNGDGSVIYFDAASENRTINVAIDRSHRPCKAAPSAEELNLPGLGDGSALAYDGDANGGVLRVAAPGCFQLPSFVVDEPETRPTRPRLLTSGGSSGNGGTWVICLDPKIDFGGDHKYVSTGLSYTDVGYGLVYNYPLDSACLWRNWQRTETGSYRCECEPSVTAGNGADSLSFVEKTCEVDAARTLATGHISVYGTEVWTGTAAHAWRDLGGGGGTTSGTDLLSQGDECEESCDGSCTDGNCATASGSGLNSVKFRLSLGMPRQGQHSGFLHFESDVPLLITPGIFSLKARDDAWIGTQHVGDSTVYRCSDDRGRDVAIVPIANGVRLTVCTHATGALDETWNIVNEGGDRNVVRITQVSRLNNVMSDETYVYDGGIWSKTDNITGVTEVLERINGLNDPTDGKLRETRTRYDVGGNQLDSVYTESSRIGSFGRAVLRETYWERDNGIDVLWRQATYWDDATHVDRHGQVRLVWGNATSWEYHDYDSRGFETLFVEQRNGSPVPSSFPEVVGGELMFANGLADARVTVFDYAPVSGDDGNCDDVDKVRCETKYVVRNGRATCIGRTWRRYTHVSYNGYDAIEEEVWRAASKTAARTDAGNAYSYTIAYDEAGESVPLVLRGRIAESLNEDGVMTFVYAWNSGSSVVEETCRWRDATAFPTYEVTERDVDFGNELYRGTCLTCDSTAFDEEWSTYDDKNRLRSTTYTDGTSITNAFSCCRKLWSVDRKGRKTLRSAVTGQDRLYYADEEVWLRELSTDSKHKVTQHYFDGLGREIATGVYVAATAGEATDPAASDGKIQCASTVSYPYGGDNYSVTVDVRGKKTVQERYSYADREERIESVYACEQETTPLSQIWTVQYRGGRQETERTWADKWTLETETTDYDANGCEVRYDVRETSDCGMVTNRIVRRDFLGRTVLEETPWGSAATTYHGATSRANTATTTAGDIVRTTTYVYDETGEKVGTAQDGVTSRSDVTYEQASGIWWKVTRAADVSGTETNAVRETRERLTGLSDAVRKQVVTIAENGIRTETTTSYSVATGEETEEILSSVHAPVVCPRRGGLALSEMTATGTSMYQYDAFGRKVREAQTFGMTECSVREMAYDEVGDVVSVLTYTNATEGVTESYGYDTFGRRTSATDALGQVTITAYDAQGNVVETSGATDHVRYAYDSQNRRTSLATTRDGVTWDTTTWDYDPRTGACRTKRYADGGQVGNTYTADGLAQRTTQPSGQWMERRYDAQRRLVGQRSSDGAQDAAFSYDAFGRMTFASNALQQVSYTPHRSGIATEEIFSMSNDTFSVLRTIDESGRIVGRNLQMISYDEKGLIRSVDDYRITARYLYDENGRDIGCVLTSGWVTVRRELTRDPYRPGLVTSVSNAVHGTVRGGLTYRHDALERVTGRNDDAFGYDGKGQVTFARLCGWDGLCEETGYAYDGSGNFSEVVRGTNAVAYAANACNQYVAAGASAPTYTLDGGLATWKGMTFAYDSAGRLSLVSTNGIAVAAYAYDAFGRRVRKVTPEATTTFFYDGWNLVREVVEHPSGSLDILEYCWGKDLSGTLDGAGGVGGLLYVAVNGDVFIPLYDANGNVTEYVDGTDGTTAATYRYDAFGRLLDKTGARADAFRFRFSTKYVDAETGLCYYGCRYYAPDLARWLTRDPIEEAGGLNLYAFCRNDGNNRFDARGCSPATRILVAELRASWLLFSKLFWRCWKGFWLSPNWLENSLQDSPVPGEFGEGTPEARFVKGSKDFESFVKKLSNHPTRRNLSGSYPHRFYDDDLSTSIHDAHISVNGIVCRRKDGASVIDADYKISDIYDFEYHDDATAKMKEEGWFLQTGNNLAYDSQGIGAIVPFPWYIEFHDKRIVR